MTQRNASSIRRATVWIALLTLSAAPARTQVTNRDSLRSYDLSEIVVEAGTDSALPASASTIQRVTLAQLARVDATSVADLGRTIPAAFVQTNSRGEVLVYLRNAGERQVAVFFEGALLNVPWDNRVDLSLVPASVVGAATVAKGAASILFGTNVLGGAINLTSRHAEEEGEVAELTAAVGSHALRSASAFYAGKAGPWRYSASAGYVHRDGLALANDADLPFSQDDPDRRTNTDLETISLLGRIARPVHDGAVGLSVLHYSGEKGVAPEGHVPPETGQVRYWRYPDTHRTMAILHGSQSVGRVRLRGAAWAGRFGQRIDAYSSVAYVLAGEQQSDIDRTAGLRFTGSSRVGGGTLRAAVNYVLGKHRQTIERFDFGGGAQNLGDGARNSYRQDIYSMGGEYERPFAGLVVQAGASLDGYTTPRTALGARSSDVSYSVSLGARSNTSESTVLRGSLGRKVRFPTARELLDTALGRFALNPQLEPESSLLGEVGVSRHTSRGSFEVIPFAVRTFNTIDQTRVVVDSVSTRQRINLEGSYTVGVEFVGTAKPLPRAQLDGSITYAYGRGFEDGSTRRLIERPAWLGTVTASYSTASGVGITVQVVHTGQAFSQNRVNELVALDRSTLVHGRISYLFVPTRTGSIGAEVFIRLDNAFDAVALPQLGLPDAGRTLRGGLALNL